MHLLDVLPQIGTRVKTDATLGALGGLMLSHNVRLEGSSIGEHRSAIAVHAIHKARHHHGVAVEVICQQRLGWQQLATMFALEGGLFLNFLARLIQIKK